METQSLKKYAPEARKAFIKAVTDQAALYGFSKNRMEPMKMDGQTAIIGGRAFPASVAWAREALEKRIKASGFEQVMESIAYTWFNRFVAIRYMELHGYLDHGYQALGWGAGGRPEILDHAVDVDLPGLNRERVIELKLDGSKDEELYRLLLLAQCNALNQSMPFLFEKIGDETELLLPANLLHTDSLIRQLVEQIDESLWAEIEIIGWLYQFYISEKKDQVIGKVVKSEDIPAATQLFTPNWIVKYMVQNSLGAQWLATYPQSPLAGQMEYYIEPAEQTDEVKAQLAAITPDQLNPEELTLIDPASGSGHILVEAYELFKAIYLERGYRQRDVPQLILERNLFGLDIDERAAQLTGFALMMKGRADDRRLFERGVKLNVMALVDSDGFDAEGLANGVELSDYGLMPEDLSELKRLFENATTFGSLIQVPEGLAGKLPGLKQLGEVTSQDLFVTDALKRLRLLVRLAELLGGRYDNVVANPPYMGSSGMNGPLKSFAKDNFTDAKSDLFACFIERGFTLAKTSGHNAMVTMQSWMFLSSFEKMRESLLRTKTIRAMAHLGARAFGSISGEVVQTAATVIGNKSVGGYRPAFLQLLDGGEEEKRAALIRGKGRFDATTQEALDIIPGSPIAYWASELTRAAYATHSQLNEAASVRQGLATADDDRFLRLWFEVSASRSAESGVPQPKWFRFTKGGGFRRWFGNDLHVVNWAHEGQELRSFDRAVIRNPDVYGREAGSWSLISSSSPGFRFVPEGAVFGHKGPVVLTDNEGELPALLGFLNSHVCSNFLRITSQTLGFEVGHVSKLPATVEPSQGGAARRLIELSRTDWNAYERSWDFQSLPLLTASPDPTPTLESSYNTWITQNRETIAEMKRLEEENNRLFIDAYGLADELTPDVPIEQITLTVNPAYRYGGKLTEEELWTRFREDTMEELVSYAIGCMMGRYSLDAPALIYAHSSNEGFDSSRYPSFPADADGIIPLTDTEWFEDDATHRLIEFIDVAFNRSHSQTNHLEKNLTFLAENLSPKKNETSRETLRRYLCDSFFKNHLQTYKNRPIYWLFTSGKQKAFQCLVYLHRYNTGTLSRIRTEYVIPLQGKMAHRLDTLNEEIASAGSSSRLKTLTQERDKLSKQQEELRLFDEQLRHYADQRIQLDLDDGVKVNYAKFGNLLAETKKVTGK